MFEISSYIPGEEGKISILVKKVYDEFVSPGYTEEGDQSFYLWIDPDAIRERQEKSSLLWTLKDDGLIIGVIEVRDTSHICLLFIDKKHQGRGGARMLFEKMKKEILRENPKIESFTVFASPFSIPIYKKLGFFETGEMQSKNGITYLPMEFSLL